jgi:hypothetical protein
MREPRCLKCKAILPFQNAVDGSASRPHNGDVAICWECGETMIFEGKGFRLPTPEEFQELLNDEDFTRAMAAVAVKLSGAQDPAAVIINDKGVTTVLAQTPDAVCEMCGKTDELRPYGPRKANGVRMRVCFGCAQKDEAEARRAFVERIEGRT